MKRLICSFFIGGVLLAQAPPPCDPVANDPPLVCDAAGWYWYQLACQLFGYISPQDWYDYYGCYPF
jgi:hypothetical protein